jgi:phenylpropionate dioxygenase-like ring-hydroxylating dioxygenase large terminal subunit
MNINVHPLVDRRRDVVSRKVFHDQEIYEREMELIFRKSWLLVGHESQIPNVGDFFLSRMGEDQVILSRSKDGKANVFLNTCRHKGMRVCRYDEGNTKLFYCPYHAWSYDLNGDLKGVPEKENYPESFDRKDWGLLKVAKVASFRGTIWATWNADAPEFEDYLGDAKEGLWYGLGPWDGGDGEVEVYGGVQKWNIPCNWKFVSENSGGDPLHNISHMSTDLSKIGPREGVGRRDPFGELFLTATRNGHGLIYERVPLDKPRAHYQLSKITSEYFEDCWRRRMARLGEKAGSPLVLANIFPNAGFHTQQPRVLLMAHPNGPRACQAWRMFFVDKEAPQEVKDFLRAYYISYSGPGGMTEQDDMENWNYASEGSAVRAAQNAPFSYVADSGSISDPFIPGKVSKWWMTERNNVAFYHAWADRMGC